MPYRFSFVALRHLRDNISIETLIKALPIPWRHHPGEIFRFECPLCFGYHTAVHPRTNLSRCFDCQKNFNTIDLIIIVRKTSFVESVSFLQQHEAKLRATKRPPESNVEPAANGAVPTLIGKILRQMAITEVQP